MKEIRFDDQVAIVTGAGQGLGRSHALGLAQRGAKVLVNDMNRNNAVGVVEEIKELGGEALMSTANVTDIEAVEQMVQGALSHWGRVDVLVNNAGILRDKSFAKMDINEFELVLRVHLMGSAICSKAVWDTMVAQQYGRIVMTTSASGMYGNFGQSNYGAAKAGIVGLMNTLCIEGAKNNIRVNTLSPTAYTNMTEGLIPSSLEDLLSPESVTAGLLTLCDLDAPSRLILCAGGGGFAKTVIHETDGIYLTPTEQSPENVRSKMNDIDDQDGMQELTQGFDQTKKFIAKAANALGIDIAM